MKIAGDREKLPDPAHHRIVLRMLLLLLHHQHLDPREDQERAEDIKDRVEILHQHRAEADHRAAHHQRADDTPEKHTVLVAGGHRERAEDHCDHEDIVHAQRFLHHIGREVFRRREFSGVHRLVHGVHRLAELEPMELISEVNEDGKREPQCDPDGGPAKRLLETDDVGFPMEHTQIQGQHR